MTKKILLKVELTDSVDSPIVVRVPKEDVSHDDLLGIITRLNFGLKLNPRCLIGKKTRMKLHLLALAVAASSFEEDVDPADDTLMYSEYSVYARASVKAKREILEKLFSSKNESDVSERMEGELLNKNLVEIGKKMNRKIVDSIEL